MTEPIVFPLYCKVHECITQVKTEQGMLNHLQKYHNTSVPAIALSDLHYARQYFQTRNELKNTTKQNRILRKALKPLNEDKLYHDTVHYYMDKKGYTLDQANHIAQKVVQRERDRRNQVTQETLDVPKT